MIKMRVSENGCVDGSSLDRERFPIPKSQLLQALILPTLDQDRCSLSSDKELASGDRTHPTEELDIDHEGKNTDQNQ